MANRHMKMLSITHHQGNGNQNYSEIHLSEWQRSTQETNVGEDWKQRNLLILLVESKLGTASLEKSMEVPQKIKNRTTL